MCPAAGRFDFGHNRVPKFRTQAIELRVGYHFNLAAEINNGRVLDFLLGELIDENIEDIDYSRRYDLIAVSAMTEQATRAYEIARKFREGNAKVVLGGIHATTLPDEAKLYADSVVVGEAENQVESVGCENDEGKQGGIDDQLPATSARLEALREAIEAFGAARKVPVLDLGFRIGFRIGLHGSRALRSGMMSHFTDPFPGNIHA